MNPDAVASHRGKSTVGDLMVACLKKNEIHLSVDVASKKEPRTAAARLSTVLERRRGSPQNGVFMKPYHVLRSVIISRSPMEQVNQNLFNPRDFLP